MYSPGTSERVLTEDSASPRGSQAITSDYFVLLVGTAIVVSLFTRRPDALLHAQFWAEDGKYFYAYAYEYGWRSILFTQLGYFLTLQRLVALVSLLVPLRIAPLIMNAVAIAIQALPPAFLLTRRFALVATVPVRVFMAFLLVAISTAPELHANITNAHWHLAIAAFMVFVAEPPDRTAWRIFDCLVVTLSGLSGPFCIFLLPIGLIVLRFRRNRWTGVLLVITSVTAVVQASAILLTSFKSRLHDPLGASPLLLLRIAGTQVVLGSLIGPNFVLRHPKTTHTAAVVAAVAAFGIMCYMLRRARIELRLLAVFGTAVAAAGLWSPMVSSGPQWPVMALPYAGARYWFVLVVAWVWTLVWLVGKKRPAAVRILGVIAITAALRTGIWNWKYPPFTDLNFPKYAAQFEQLPAGTSIEIPINPPGRYMVLRKH